MPYIAVYEHYIDDFGATTVEDTGSDPEPLRFTYPKVTLEYNTDGEKINAMEDARTVIQAQRIKDRTDRCYSPGMVNYYIVEQNIIEQL